MVIRFRCDASSNYDQIYLDDIVIEACTGNLIIDIPYAESRSEPGRNKIQTDYIDNFNLYPNPARDIINIVGSIPGIDFLKIELINTNGQIIMKPGIG